jgi:hypothetical protein
LSVLGRTGFTRGLRLALRGSRRCWGPADAEFLLHENLGEAEAAAGQLAGFVVREEFDPFFSDFSEEDLPGFGAEIINRQERTILVFTAGLLGLTAALVLVTAQAFLLAAGLFSVAAGLLGLAALLGGLLLSLGIAGRAGVALILPGRAIAASAISCRTSGERCPDGELEVGSIGSVPGFPSERGPGGPLGRRERGRLNFFSM